MIEVRVMLRSAFGSHRDKVLGTMTIANDGSGTHTCGHYNVTARVGQRGKLRTGRVENFSRQSNTGMALVLRALKATGFR